jgi:ParB family transcriptional regulator, chromosome partitioning protein
MTQKAESIKTQGVLSPILVRPLPEGFPEHFEIVTGARRFRAAQLVGLDSVPVRIVSLSDNEALEVQVVENLQRTRDWVEIDRASARSGRSVSEK